MMLAMMVPPISSPIFMAPLAGMMFLLGAIVHQAAGHYWNDPDPQGAWFGASVVGLALQVGAFVILIGL